MNIISKGVDISKWQGDFDMDKAVSEGFTFAIVKGGGGDVGFYVDGKFARNYENAKRLGIPVGCYWFSRATSEEAAVQEADWFYENCLKGRQFELPVYMDVEHKDMLNLGKRKLTDVVHAFCQRLEELGYWVGIYSSLSAFSYQMIDSELQRYAHWVAHWAKECGYKDGCMGMWQYGGETNLIRSSKVAGVVCDQNYMLTDYPALIKAKGLNGFGEPQTELEEAAPAAPEPDTEKEWAQDDAESVWVFSLIQDGEKYLTDNFQVKEFACHDGSDPVFIHPQLPEWCQLVRDTFGYPFSPNSAYRTVEHNAKPEVGGAMRSYHVYGRAVDIPAGGDTTPQMLYDFFEDLLGDSGELGLYDWGVHVAVCKDKRRFRG